MMQDSHVRQVLDMLKEGKITVDEADRLIQQISASETSQSEHELAQPAKKGPPKFLRVSVVDNEDNVDIRVPIKLLKFGLDIGQVLPEEHRSKIEEHGVDFNSFKNVSGDDLVQALDGLTIDVNEENGAFVKVFLE